MNTVSVNVHAKQVAERVRAEVARKQLQGQTIAAALGVSPAAVSRRMLGQVEFSVSDVQIIAGLLEMPVSELISDSAVSS